MYYFVFISDELGLKNSQDYLQIVLCNQRCGREWERESRSNTMIPISFSINSCQEFPLQVVYQLRNVWHHQRLDGPPDLRYVVFWNQPCRIKPKLPLSLLLPFKTKFKKWTNTNTTYFLAGPLKDPERELDITYFITKCMKIRSVGLSTV